MQQDSKIELPNDAAMSQDVGLTKLARSQGCQRPVLDRQRVQQWSAARVVNDRYTGDGLAAETH